MPAICITAEQQLRPRRDAEVHRRQDKPLHPAAVLFSMFDFE